MFHLVSYCCIRRTQYITSIGVFYKYWDFTWRVSDCEELVVGYSQGMMGLVLGIITFLIHVNNFPLFQDHIGS